MKYENNFENALGNVFGVCGSVGSVCSLFHLLNKQNQIVKIVPRETFSAHKLKTSAYEIRKSI